MLKLLSQKFSIVLILFLLITFSALLTFQVKAATAVSTLTVDFPDIREGDTTPTTGTVVLDSAPTADVLITFQAITGGAPVSNQIVFTPATITFTPANWNVPQNFQYIAFDDAVIESSAVYFIVTTQSSTDPASNSTQTLIKPQGVLDNDLFHTMTPSAPAISEAGGTTTVGIAMNSLTFMANSLITITTDNPCVTVSPTTMNFTEATWDVKQNLVITAAASCDNQIIDSRKVKISLLADDVVSSFDWQNNLKTYDLTLTDNDTASVLTSATTVNITEGGATGTYTMKLTSQPTADVTATIAGGANATASPATLTFTPANWNVAQTVTVTAVDNAVVDGTHTQVITNTFTSTDTNYNTQTPQVTATITDNDVTPTSTDTDGDGIPNATDADQDGDGILNIYDNDVDGDGIPNATDTDDDGDGTPDATDTTPTGAGDTTDNDGDGIPNATDPDQDGDGILNVYDNDVDGDGIPNATDTDDDGDGTADATDTTQPNDADGYGSATDTDGDGIPNSIDPDQDGDGILNVYDNDVDGDGIPNATDTDDDNDGTLDAADTAQPNDADGYGTTTDTDGDGIPNATDPDQDGDGILNIYDNDVDGDGIPNATDTDDDGDGTPDATDTTPTGAGTATDNDGDGIPNATDPDQDGDGILNIYDNDVDGDGIPNATDTDDDNDGILDAADTTQPNDADGYRSATDTDGDGIPNATDPDQDGDGTLNIYDNDVDGDGIPNATDTDDDGDGTPDATDTVQPNDADGYGTITDVDGDGIPNWNDPDLDGDGISNSADPDVDGDGIPNTSDNDDDNDGIPNDIENKYANGDANGDGIKDSLQSNVYTGENPVTGAYNTLTLSNTDCKITNGFKVTSESAQAVQDEKFEYPLGLFGFKVLCGTKGATVNVSVLFDKVYDTSKFSYRKYNTTTKQWLNLTTFVAYSTVTVNSKNVTKAEFTLKDGGTGDEDGVENGIIQDPSGPAKDASLTTTGSDMNLMLVGLMTILVGSVVILKPRLMKKN